MSRLRQFYPHKGIGYYCALFGHSRQGWYEQLKKKERAEMADALVLKLVREIREDLPRAGVPKLHFMLGTALPHMVSVWAAMRFTASWVNTATCFATGGASSTPPTATTATANIPT